MENFNPRGQGLNIFLKIWKNYSVTFYVFRTDLGGGKGKINFDPK